MYCAYTIPGVYYYNGKAGSVKGGQAGCDFQQTAELHSSRPLPGSRFSLSVPRSLFFPFSFVSPPFHAPALNVGCDTLVLDYGTERDSLLK
ncbi:uncharacterized [Tachysurus ichikawai]